MPAICGSSLQRPQDVDVAAHLVVGEDLGHLGLDDDLAVLVAQPDREGLAVHRRLGAVLEDAPEPFALVLAHGRLLVLGLADLGDEQHHAVEDEERARDDVGHAGVRQKLARARRAARRASA